jgi:hypothetical protein
MTRLAVFFSFAASVLLIAQRLCGAPPRRGRTPPSVGRSSTGRCCCARYLRQPCGLLRHELSADLVRRDALWDDRHGHDLAKPWYALQWEISPGDEYLLSKNSNRSGVAALPNWNLLVRRQTSANNHERSSSQALDDPTPQATLSCTFSHPTYRSTPTFRASSLAAAILAICSVVLFTRQPVSGIIRHENSHCLDKFGSVRGGLRESSTDKR